METEKPLRVLMLEDNQDDVFLIKRLLNKAGFSFEALAVDTREEFMQAIREFSPDVVLSDHGLPQFNSIQALKVCQQEGHDVPFILVTGTVSDEFARKCIAQGADDYIFKIRFVAVARRHTNSIGKAHVNVELVYSTGMLNEKVAPLPGSAVAETVPPCLLITR